MNYLQNTGHSLFQKDINNVINVEKTVNFIRLLPFFTIFAPEKEIKRMKRTTNVILRNKPSFRTGVKSLFSFGTNANRFRQYIGGNDFSDISSDWQTVGNDMRMAMNQFGKEAKLNL